MNIHTGKLLPTINYEESDPECPLDYVTNGVELIALEVALNNSFGFGGDDACLVVRRYRS
jgi:3-oxoacyl-[acyl-carrier-protein] synthase II